MFGLEFGINQIVNCFEGQLMKRILFNTILFAILISSCSQKQPLSTSTVTPQPAAIRTLTPTPIATITPFIQPAMTFMPTLTGLPTLQAGLEAKTINELLSTNNGCALPCFWGIVPGKTTWGDAVNFLQTFSSVEYGHDTNSGRSKEYFFDVNGPNQVGMRIKMNADNDLISFIEVSDFDSQAYHLAEFLENNGKPDEIVLRTYKSFYSNTSDVVPFLIYMYYSQPKMLVAYGYSNGKISGDWITGCIEGSPSLQIWAGDKPHNLDEAMQIMSWYDPYLIYLDISDATLGELDVEGFYETFKNNNAEPCFRTPINLWPEP
jgi:hypothetical protein